MLIARVLMLVTFLVIIGYFIQLSGQWGQGFLKPFSKYLSLWVFVLAGLVVADAALMPALGMRGAMAQGRPGIGRFQGPGGGPGFAPGRGQRFGNRFFFRRFGPGGPRGAQALQLPQEAPAAKPGAPGAGAASPAPAAPQQTAP